MPWLLLVAALVLAVAIAALTRVSFTRKPGVEGLLDSAAVASYDRMSWSPQQRFIQPGIVAELRKMAPTGILLNIGCGPGYLEALAAPQLPSVEILATDIGWTMLKTAKRNIAALGLADRVSFQAGDVHHLPLADGSIDVAVSTVSLHHWRDAPVAMAEIRRVLKPGGQFLIYDLRRDTRRWFYWFLWLLEHLATSAELKRVDAPLDSLRAAYTPAEMDAILSRTGWAEWSVRGRAGWMTVWGRK